MRCSLRIEVKAVLSFVSTLLVSKKQCVIVTDMHSALSVEIRHMPSCSTRTNLLHMPKRTLDTFFCKDISTNITRCGSVKCPERMRREAISQKKRNSFHHTNTYSTSKYFSPSLKTCPQEAHMLALILQPLLRVISSFNFLPTLPLAAMFFLGSLWVP